MASNPDFDEGQRALATNNDGVPAPKLPPAVRKLADTLSPGALDGAPSTVGLDPDAPRGRRKAAPVPKTPRPPRREGKAPPPKRARAAPKDGDAQPVAPLAPPASPPAKWRGSGDDPDDAMELLSDSDDEAPAAADDGDDSDRDSVPAPAPQLQPPFPVGCVVAEKAAPQHALEVVSVDDGTYTLKYLGGAGAWQGHEIIRSEASLNVYGAALPPRRGRAAPPAPPPKRVLKAATPDVEPPRATPSPTPTPPARAAPRAPLGS